MMLRLVLIAILALLTRPLAAADWSLVPEKSEIAFSGIHLGNVFEGVFKTWSVEISFEPDQLDAAHARVLVQTGSATTGNKLYDGTLTSGDWFDAARHPEAVFEATGFRANDTRRLSAEGVLLIKGKPVPLTLDFTLDITGSTATMTASHMFDRVALGLGAGSDPTGKWVSREIFVNITLVATTAAGR